MSRWLSSVLILTDPPGLQEVHSDGPCFYPLGPLIIPGSQYFFVLQGSQIHFSNPRIRIGTAGWNIPGQYASLFPTVGTHLQRYSQVLNCAEINSSFYRPHKPETWQRWANSVPGDFHFSVKAPGAITHESGLDCRRRLLTDFFKQLSALGSKLGPVLFQLPPKMQFDAKRAAIFLKMMREEFSGDVAWEPRHESWFRPAVDDLFQGLRIARVAADPACVKEALCPGGWNGLRYYRLHGSPRKYYSAYGADFLQKLAAETTTGPGKVWCIFDNTASGAALGNVLELIRLL